jgi:succinate-semialdehyde dehydrogenase/glutarate-semialdehyde dehydrogenase
MTTTQTAKGSNGSGATSAAMAPVSQIIESYAPVSGERLGEVAVMDPGEVQSIVDRARTAQRAWAALSFEARAARLRVFRDAIVDRAEEVADLLSRETGKPRHEALLHEVMVVADLITYFSKAASKILAPRPRALHLFKHRKSIIHYSPRGVVGVIGPWNFPFQLPLRDVVVAVAAGNAAVVKPSEVTPLIMMKAKEIWDHCGMPPDLLGIVTGRGATGAALIDSGIDYLAFTGSVGTGKKVAAACGERLIPCVMELGGKAPLIACSDCDIERTAQAIVNGGFCNSGQVCISVERVYAHRSIHDQLLKRTVELTRNLRQGDPATEFCDTGGITFEKQIDVAEKHIADAVENGAELCCGGSRVEDAKMAFLPTILAGCTHEHSVMTDEIFGPIVPFMKVDSEDEALRLANESHLGLNAYVFTESATRGRRLAEQVQAGSVLVNEVLINGGITEAPFGGIKDSGFGRVMGEEGLRAMCHTKHICLERVKMPRKNPLGFPYTEKSYRFFNKALRVMYSSGGVFRRLSQFF